MNLPYLILWEAKAFLYLLAAILVLKMLTRGIKLGGLLDSKTGRQQVSAERVQLLISTLVVASKYLSDVAHSTNGTMPDVDPHMLYLFGGSSGIYASIKAFSALRSK